MATSSSGHDNPAESMKSGTKGFHHITLRVMDFDSSLRFYIEGMGFEKTHQWLDGSRRTALLDSGNGALLEVVEGDTLITDIRSPITRFALTTEDCEASLDAARNAGAFISREPEDISIPGDEESHFRVAFCRGPDNEEIEFVQPMKSGGTITPPPGEM